MRELTAPGIPPVEGVNLIERLRNTGDPEVFGKFVAGGSPLVTAREIDLLRGAKVELGSYCMRYANRCRHLDRLDGGPKAECSDMCLLLQKRRFNRLNT
jgi:hypothetical protein